jgi:hypothetical protein
MALLSDGNANLRGLNVTAASADTNLGCTIGPASTEPLKEAGIAPGPPTAFMAIDRVAEVGSEERAFVQ